jgi:hypothetical protein
MAAIATGIGYGVAYLTGERTLMDLMLYDRIGRSSNLIVAAFAAGTLFTFIAVIIAFRIMHTGAIMAGNTIHTPLAEVNITRNTFVFAHVFIANTGTMASCTGAGHRRCLNICMTIQQSTTYTIRLGNMAITTGCVAGLTMISEHFI